jgi:hypothetical protein
VQAEALAEVKKKAENEGRTIVFIDESGLSQRPHRCRTWAPRRQTPVLQYHFNWKMLSAGANRAPIGFYQAYPGLSVQDIHALIADSKSQPGSTAA